MIKSIFFNKFHDSKLLAAIFSALSLLLPIEINSKTIEELLRCHLAAIGGERALRGIYTVLAKGEIEILGTGLRGSIESRSAAPCFSSSEICFGFFKIQEGFDGEKIWIVDPNGNLSIRRDSATLEFQRTICALESHDYIFGAEGIGLEELATDTLEGTPCKVVSLSVEGGSQCRLFFDEASCLLRRMEIRAPEGEAIHTYGDYRKCGATVFPFLVREELPALGQRVEIHYSQIVPNATIDPAIFFPPPSKTKDYRISSGASSVELAFEYRSRHIFLPVRIEGLKREVDFLLDSGASMTVIDSAIASELSLPLGGLLPGASAGGMANFRIVRLPSFRIDDIVIEEQTAVSFPISGLLRRYGGKHIGGILGNDFLSRFVTRIDYEHCRVTFFEPSSFEPLGTETEIDAPLFHNVFSLPVRLDGKRSGSFILDTGARSSLVRGAFLGADSLSDSILTVEIALRGAGGQEPAKLRRLDTLAIGTIFLVEPVIAVSSSARGLSALQSIDGLLGNDILERFTVTLDYGRQKVLLEKNDRFYEPFFPDRSGLELARMRDGKLMIVNVIKHSPADRAGLKPGDKIVKIDRARAEKIRTLNEAVSLFEAEEGKSYRLEIERYRKKKIVKLTLAKYL